MNRAGPVQWAMVAPAQALLILVIALPAAYVFWLSLAHSSYGQAPVWAGWDNYRTILADPYFWRALLNTLIVVNVVVYVELAVALGVAVLFAREAFRAAGDDRRGALSAPYAIQQRSWRSWSGAT